MKKKNYDIAALINGIATRVVFVDKRPDSVDLKFLVCKEDSSYRLHPDLLFPPKKIGPFKMKNKTTLWDTLYNTAKIKKICSEYDKERAVRFLQESIKKAGLSGLERRTGSSLTASQLDVVAVMHKAFNGNTGFVLSDCFFKDKNGNMEICRDKDSYISVARWIESYEDFKFQPYDYIWITDIKPWKLFAELGENAFSQYHSYFYAKDNTIFPLDSEKLKTEFVSGGVFLDLAEFVGDSFVPDEPEEDEIDEDLKELLDFANDYDSEEKEQKLKKQRQRAEKEKAIYEAEKKGLALLEVFYSEPADGGAYEIYANIQTGSVTKSDCYSSVRTGTKYKVVTTPMNITYFMLQQALNSGEIDADELKEDGYDPEMLKNYDVDDEIRFCCDENSFGRTISANQFGAMTTVSLLVTPLENNGISGENTLFDIEVNDLLLQIK